LSKSILKLNPKPSLQYADNYFRHTGCPDSSIPSLCWGGSS
jgi:hypothetical protein